MASQPQRSGGFAWLALGLSWLIPGAGFMIYGRWGRGIAHFLMVGLTFMLGLALKSGVDWPSWSIRAEDFNLINNFTFIVQMGGGFWALLSFGASNFMAEGAAGALAWFQGLQEYRYYELGSYFLIVAGALNYFALGNFYDRVIHVHPRFAAQEATPQEGAA
jgi:hypothetical protein